MAFTDINSEDRLVRKTFAEHLRDKLGWNTVYAWNDETLGPDGTLGRTASRRPRPIATRLRSTSGSRRRYGVIPYLRWVSFSCGIGHPAHQSLFCRTRLNFPLIGMSRILVLQVPSSLSPLISASYCVGR